MRKLRADKGQDNPVDPATPLDILKTLEKTNPPPHTVPVEAPPFQKLNKFSSFLSKVVGALRRKRRRATK
jgi:hypothetical protein